MATIAKKKLTRASWSSGLSLALSTALIGSMVLTRLPVSEGYIQSRTCNKHYCKAFWYSCLVSDTFLELQFSFMFNVLFHSFFLFFSDHAISFLGVVSVFGFEL